jgi:carboxymethylenebutenolidase
MEGTTMNEDGSSARERVRKARELLERCGVAGGLGDEDAVRRADEIAAAAADYAGAAGAANAAVFDEHIRDEFELRDADATMATMSADPYLNHVPVMTGGVGREEVHRFYRDDFVSAWPGDTESRRISRTVGESSVVDELIVTFTHDTEMPFMLPGVDPTGKRVDLPHVVVVGFEGGKVAHEHIYWDQGSVLVQTGLLDPSGLPLTGAEQARRQRELSAR